MNAKPYFFVTATVFALVALLHMTRLFMGWQVHLGEQAIPMAVSWAGLAIAGAMSVWGFRLAGASGASMTK